jgi:hypothetical protein
MVRSMDDDDDDDAMRDVRCERFFLGFSHTLRLFG